VLLKVSVATEVQPPGSEGVLGTKLVSKKTELERTHLHDVGAREIQFSVYGDSET
jgi:hypothetical protein